MPQYSSMCQWDKKKTKKTLKNGLLSLSLLPHPSITSQPSRLPTPHFWSASHHGYWWPSLCPRGDILTGLDKAVHSSFFQLSSPAESVMLPHASLTVSSSSLSFCLLFPLTHPRDVPMCQGSTTLLSFLHLLVRLKYHQWGLPRWC